MPNMTCPHCQAFSFLSPSQHWQANVPGRGPVDYAVWLCTSCQRPILGENVKNEPKDYVPRTAARSEFPDVPPAVAEDAQEAHKCASVEAWRACAAMARRALQAAAQNKGAPPDKRLIGQIDWLAENDHITEQMKDVAHQIRLGGNLGAHPDKDGLRDVGEQEARAILQFLDDFFRYVYEIPASLDRLSQAAPPAP